MLKTAIEGTTRAAAPIVSIGKRSIETRKPFLKQFKRSFGEEKVSFFNPFEAHTTEFARRIMRNPSEISVRITPAVMLKWKKTGGTAIAAPQPISFVKLDLYCIQPFSKA